MTGLWRFKVLFALIRGVISVECCGVDSGRNVVEFCNLRRHGFLECMQFVFSEYRKLKGARISQEPRAWLVRSLTYLVVF
jgi:hypothetical protein